MIKYKTLEEKKEAVRLQKKAEHERNKERYKAYMLEYRRKHKIKARRQWKKWYAEHKEARLQYNKEYWKVFRSDPAYKERHKQYEQNRIKKYPGKRAAVQAVNKAILQGKLIRQPCAICKSTVVQGHHKDYRRKLDVVWLCLAHHKELHNAKSLLCQ